MAQPDKPKVRNPISRMIVDARSNGEVPSFVLVFLELVPGRMYGRTSMLPLEPLPGGFFNRTGMAFGIYHGLRL